MGIIVITVASCIYYGSCHAAVTGRNNNAPPQDVHILIPGTWEYIRLHSKGGFKLTCQVEVAIN